MTSPVVSRDVLRIGKTAQKVQDTLSTEEPMEIRLVYQEGGERKEKNLSITMRTPGEDFELAAGFLFTEGIVRSPADVTGIEYCSTCAIEERDNVVLVQLREGLMFDETLLHRHFYTTSSCGVCGKTSLAAVRAAVPKSPLRTESVVTGEILRSLPKKLSGAQTTFQMTGGLHAAGIFSTAGDLAVAREDIGRHNALDKVIGERFMKDRLPLPDHLVAVSGRASFELVQKALVAGIPILAAVGAASSLAVDLAREHEMTLVGFLRDDGFNVYSGSDRIIQ